MRHQTSNACGPNALHNALQCLGRDISQEKLEKLAKTTTEGSDENDVLRAARKYAMPLTFTATDPVSAMAELRGHLVVGSPVVLAVDQDAHWVAAIGLCGSRIVLADGADNSLVIVGQPGELVGRWRSGAGMYYGIALYRKAK